MSKEFDKSWDEWLELNLRRGCDKDGIFKILIDEGFDQAFVERKMGHKPTIEIESIINPLKTNTSSNTGTWFKLKFDKIRNAFKIIYKKDASFTKYDSSKIYIPNANKAKTDDAEFYTLENFLTDEECKKITTLIKKKLRPSTIVNKHEPDKNFRTSRTCDLGIMDDPFIKEIDLRICKTLGIDPSYSEVMQGQYYQPGEEFKAHTDYFEGKYYDEFAAEQGQRTYTFMVYLNDVKKGGETEFLKLDKKIMPKLGTAIIWNNLNDDGSVNPKTLHQAHPVKAGYKSIITKWFRSNGEGSMFTKTDAELKKNLTNKGFMKTSLDQSLYKKIKVFYEENKDSVNTEIVEGFIHRSDSDKPASKVVELPEKIKSEIHQNLKPILEEWSGVNLEPTYVYGIRVYERGAILVEHRDRKITHIVSTIINVDQNVDVDWPLFIDDHYYRTHKINLKPGEVLFYEGARLKHGRPEPLEGESYANIFCHFKLES